MRVVSFGSAVSQGHLRISSLRVSQTSPRHPRAAHPTQPAPPAEVAGSTAPARRDGFGTAISCDGRLDFSHPRLTAARAAAVVVSDLSATEQPTKVVVEAAIRHSLQTRGGARGCAA